MSTEDTSATAAELPDASASASAAQTVDESMSEAPQPSEHKDNADHIDDDEEEPDNEREVAPKRQRREADQQHVGATEAAEAAAGALAEAAAGSVLDPVGDEAAVARLRGLPWSFGAQEVCGFLEQAGTKVQPEAVTMLHNAAGEAFVVLETQAQMQEVLAANRTQVGKRYVEVFASTSAEKQAACERHSATMKEDAGYKGVLRMRGLPYAATVEDVLTFFGNPAELASENVTLLKRADGRFSGDAYVVFDTEEAATAAMRLDKQKLRNRWVDLFQSSKGELYALTSVGGIMTAAAPAGAGGTNGALGEGYSVVKLRGLPWNVSADDISTFVAPVVIPKGGIHLMKAANGRPAGLAYVELSTEEDQESVLAKDKQSIGGRYIDIFSCSQTELQARLAGGLERGGRGEAADGQFVKLRGLPYSATEHQVVAFFTPLQVVAVQIALNNSGQPSGFGFVQFRNAADAATALQKSNQVLGSRYVEVFRCNRSDMEQAHQHAMTMAPMMRPPPMFGGGMGHHPARGMQPSSMGGPGIGPPPRPAAAAGPPQGPPRGGHPGGENAYSAYQAALQALSHRPPPASYPPPAGANPYGANPYQSSETPYPTAAMAAANFGNAEVPYSTAPTPGSGYGQAGGGYPPPATGFTAEAGGYMAAVPPSTTPSPPTASSYGPASAPGAYPHASTGYGTDYYAQYAQQYGYYAPQ